MSDHPHFTRTFSHFTLHRERPSVEYLLVFGISVFAVKDIGGKCNIMMPKMDTNPTSGTFNVQSSHHLQHISTSVCTDKDTLIKCNDAAVDVITLLETSIVCVQPCSHSTQHIFSFISTILSITNSYWAFLSCCHGLSSIIQRVATAWSKDSKPCIVTLKVLGMTIDALGHF